MKLVPDTFFDTRIKVNCWGVRPDDWSYDFICACDNLEHAERLCREFNNKEDTPFFRDVSQAILKEEFSRHEMEKLSQTKEA